MRRIRLKFKDKSEHVTLKELNKEYGDKGQTFATEEGARRFQQENGGYVTKIINYRPCDISVIVDLAGEFYDSQPKKGAKPYTEGWLVSLPQTLDSRRFL